MPKESLRIPDSVISRLCAPGDSTIPLRLIDGRLQPADGSDRVSFPLVNGAPILINEERSIFKIEDFCTGRVTTMDLRPDRDPVTPRRRVRSLVGGLIPEKSRAIPHFAAQDAIDSILEENASALILVIGAGDVRFRSGREADVVYTDVALGPDTGLVADAQDLPFIDETFDAVLAIAVLEHVADPFRAVAEMRRVLKPEGFVYSVTPFMQQVHMGRFDFTRFTALGHRRLFRWFDEVRAGVVNGPGMALAWSIEYLALCISERPLIRRGLSAVSRFFAWPFLLLDGMLAQRAGAYDCASAYYFFGRLRSEPLHDRDIVAQYKGLL